MRTRFTAIALLTILGLSACGAPATVQPVTPVASAASNIAIASPATGATPSTAAPAATATVTVEPSAEPPTPTFERVTDTEPTVGALAASGTAAWRDQVLRNDTFLVTVNDLPPPQAGESYAAWLGGKDGSLPLGTLGTGGSGPATLTYVSPSQQNLLSAYDRVFITQGPAATATTTLTKIVLAGALPEKALAHMRHVLFSIGVTPGKIGFALGLRQETDELLRHAQFLKDALDAGNLALEKVHAEHIINLIAGKESPDFGDLNKDGKIQNPGDGFGLLQNGTQDGYIKGMGDHAKLAADSPDATDAIKLHAGHVQIAGDTTRLRVQDIHDRAHKILQAGGIADTQQDVLNVLALAQQTIQGVDLNNDEQITPTPGEGGVLTAYQHAQLMAGMPLTADAAAAAAAPAAVAATPPTAAQEITIEIGDNSFTPSKITVPVGATVVWKHNGQRPHTVTADDGTFDSGKLQNGATFKQTFSKAGTFAYYCSIHGGKGGEGMAAAIVVVDQSAAAAPPANAPAPSTSAATAAQPTAERGPGAAGTVVQVTIGDNSFTPKEIRVPVGGAVIWTNSGQRPHTVTADNNAFTSGTLQTGATFKQTFDKPGLYPYYCEFHGGPGGVGMAGVINVGGP